MNIQPGKHQVELSFFPKSVNMTETIAYIAYVLLFLLVAGGVFMEYRRRKEV
jgi:cytochrome bd-type quinol oxidase subunit 2